MRRAFVVQFSNECEPGKTFLGRVEHVPSGDAIHFRSLDEFLGFLTRSIHSERKPGTDARRAPGNIES